MDEKVKYWVDLYDYDTAIAMQQSSRYLYVGFMCHQTIEKILKAYYVSALNEPAPYTHRLSLLIEKAGLSEQFSDHFNDLIDLLEPLNIEARYPSYKESLLKSLSKDKCA
jgi:HEPN domain-containing protein